MSDSCRKKSGVTKIDSHFCSMTKTSPFYHECPSGHEAQQGRCWGNFASSFPYSCYKEFSWLKLTAVCRFFVHCGRTNWQCGQNRGDKGELMISNQSDGLENRNGTDGMFWFPRDRMETHCELGNFSQHKCVLWKPWKPDASNQFQWV